MVLEMKKEIETFRNLLTKGKVKKGSKNIEEKKKKEKEKEDGQVSDESDDSEDDWKERIQKQNKNDWRKMWRHVKRVGDKDYAKHMFKVFGVKYDDKMDSQTLCVLKQRLCVIAIERDFDGESF